MALVTDLIPQVVVKRGGQWNHYLMRCQSRHVLHWRGGEGRLSPKITSHLFVVNCLRVLGCGWGHSFLCPALAQKCWMGIIWIACAWGIYLLILIILLYCLELTNLFTSHHQGLRLVPSRLSSYVCVCHCQVVFLVYSSSIGFTSNGNGQAQAEKKIFDLIDGRMNRDRTRDGTWFDRTGNGNQPVLLLLHHRCWYLYAVYDPLFTGPETYR